jgi:aspartokinase
MAYYGASVIHPGNAPEPLLTTSIPRRVRVVCGPMTEGTLIPDCQHRRWHKYRKTDQCLLSFASKVFRSSEENWRVFAALARAGQAQD